MSPRPAQGTLELLGPTTRAACSNDPTEGYRKTWVDRSSQLKARGESGGLVGASEEENVEARAVGASEHALASPWAGSSEAVQTAARVHAITQARLRGVENREAEAG